ncbi:MAG: uncharacterized protein A8A55_2837 [Amphiamblys sp. WSBS2006]|nr:MAG: uncharacterized protein A8A55_2837 [Amphiamblys sp. WSBS2006]
MFDLAQESFAKQGDRFFLDESRGVIIVPEAVLEKIHEDIQKERVFLYEKRQEVLEVLEVVKQRVMKELMQREQERHKELEEKGIFGTGKRDFSAAECMGCGGEPMGGVFLFPLCEEAHHYACLECLDKEVNRYWRVTDRAECRKTLVCPILTSTCKANGDTFGMDEYRKAAGGNEEVEIRLSALAAQLQAPASFSLTRDLPNEAVLLTDQTTVMLSNIEISVELFFVLLFRTKITIDGSFFIGEHNDNEDCIREHGMMGETPVCLTRDWGAVSSLALENIERMPPSSIGCVLEKINLVNTGLINILPKLRIHEDSEIELLSLYANRREHVAAVLAQKKPFCVRRRVKEMTLGEYAVGVITKMSLKDCEVESLYLHAYEKEQVAEVLKQEKPFCVGRVKHMFLHSYAVCVVTKMGHEDSEIELLNLNASEKEHVAEVIAQEKPFCVGRVKGMILDDYAVGVITKMSLKDCEFEDLCLYATKREHVAEVLAQEKPFCVGRVKGMRLYKYAASVITRMTIHEDNTMKNFVLDGDKKHFSRILKEGDNSIDLGRIRTGGLCVPEKIKRKLRYTLVDGEGEEVLEEESDEEVLEEEEPSQRGNLLE